MRLAVLGRGKSLLWYKDHSRMFDKIYIVNDFNREIPMLGAEHFVGREVVHVVGRESSNALSESIYGDLGIECVQSNCFLPQNFIRASSFPLPVKMLPKSMKKRGYPTLPWDLMHKHTSEHGDYKKLGRFLEATYSAQILEAQKKPIPIRAWPTTGILAIDLALVENAIGEIHLFGFDMYAEDYLVKSNRAYQNSEWTKSKMMVYHLDQLMKEFMDVKFHQHKTK
ncbi:MAG: hypothetical protein ACTSWQ_09880 [Candidatus Thorarchaeota archaeon]